MGTFGIMPCGKFIPTAPSNPLFNWKGLTSGRVSGGCSKPAFGTGGGWLVSMVEGVSLGSGLSIVSCIAGLLFISETLAFIHAGIVSSSIMPPSSSSSMSMSGFTFVQGMYETPRSPSQ